MLGSDVIFQTLFYQTYFSTKGTIGHVGQRYDLSNFDLSNMFFHKRDISENLYQFKILVVCFHSYLHKIYQALPLRYQYTSEIFYLTKYETCKKNVSH